MHNKLLARQVNKYLGIDTVLPENVQKLLAAVEAAYDSYERDRTLMERALDLSSGEFREVTKELELILASVKEGITLSNAASRFLIYNQEMEVLTGYSFAEANNAGDYNRLIHPDPSAAQAAVAELGGLKVGEKRESETTIRCKDGTEKSVLVSTVVIKQNAEPLFLSAFRDITKLKQAELAIRADRNRIEQEVIKRTTELRLVLADAQREKDKMAAILHSIGDGVFVLDEQRRIVLVNSVTEALSGYASEELLGTQYRQHLNFIFENRQAENTEFIDQVFAKGTPSSISNHTRLVQKSGSQIAVADCASPLKDEQGLVIGVVVVFRDVSRERQVERMKDEFISLASHQLRTPLTSIRWGAELLRKSELTADQELIVGGLYLSSCRLVDLVNGLLNISRIESGRVIIEPKPTILTELVEQVVQSLSSQIEAKRLQVTLPAELNLPMIPVDPKLISQVYLNLVSNAIKYTPSGGQITINIERDEEWLRTVVEDSGLGIPEAEQGRIFEKFFRARNVKTQEGTGLGLYFVKAIVEASGGKIGFTSREGQGTTFWIQLPLVGSRLQEGEARLD